MEVEIKLCDKLYQQYCDRAMKAKSFEIFKSLMFLADCMLLRKGIYQMQARMERV